MTSDVIGYVRVSSEQQTEGVSLAAQRRAIETYCKLHGLRLERIESDEGISGKSMGARPGINRIEALVRGGKVGGVIVFKLDRLARRTLDAVRFAELCQQKGIRLHLIREQVDTGTPQGAFFYQVLAAFGEMERKQIGERTQAALRHKRACGQKTGGRVPFGYAARLARHRGKSVKLLEALREEQQAIRAMKRARQRGRSFRQIASMLERHGVRTKTGGRKWHPFCVQAILKRSQRHG